jgi:glutaredoxin
VIQSEREFDRPGLQESHNRESAGTISGATYQFCWNAISRVAKLRLVSAMRQVVMYSRKGCHLCEIVKETLVKLQRRGGFVWSEIDVDSDEQLRRQFTDEVPVIFIDGRKAFKYRLDEREFLRKLAS